MAGTVICYSTAAEVALAAATAKVIIHVQCSANRRAKIRAWGIYFDGVVSTGIPVHVRVCRDTTATAPTGGTAITAHRYNPSNAETLATTGTTAPTGAYTEGTLGHILHVHPQSGYERIYPPGSEPEIAGDTGWYIEATAAAIVNAVAWVEVEE